MVNIFHNNTVRIKKRPLGLIRKRHCALLGFPYLSPHPIQSGSSSQIYDTTDWLTKQYKCMAIYMDGISCVQSTGGGQRRGEVPMSQNEMTFIPAPAGQITSPNFSTIISFLAIRLQFVKSEILQQLVTE
jgi:hypothetical protein